MDRRSLLKKSCGMGACGCVFSGLLAASQAKADIEQEKPKEPVIPEWHYGFMRERFQKLMAILHKQLDPDEFSKTIQELGKECAKGLKEIEGCKNDPEKYFKLLKAWGEHCTWDKEKGEFIVTSGSERTDCFCPLVDTKTMPQYMCDCSLGWQKQTFETVLGKEVEVELLMSVLRGDKKCGMKITIKGDLA